MSELLTLFILAIIFSGGFAIGLTRGRFLKEEDKISISNAVSKQLRRIFYEDSAK